MKYVADTNVLINNPSLLDGYDNIVILNHVLRELDKLKLSDGIKSYKARVGSRYIDNNLYRIEFDFTDYRVKDYRLDPIYEDNKIIQACINNDYTLLTYDRNMKHVAMGYGVNVVDLSGKIDGFTEFKGFKEVYMTQDELHKLYQSLSDNQCNLLVNEYLFVYDDLSEDLLDMFKWDGTMLYSLRNHKNKLNFNIITDEFGEFTPYDAHQMAVVDSIRSNKVTVVRGAAGTGKSLLTLNTAWKYVEDEGYKLVVFVNPTPLKDSQEIGFYTGNRLEKLLQSSVGTMLKSKFGDEQVIIQHIQKGDLEILPFVDIRGYDTGDSKTIIWVLEAQNSTSELLKTGLQRGGCNTKTVIDGDYHAQVDKDVYSAMNGMKRVSEVFRGKSLYGEIELQKIRRSDVAEIAELM
jgi:PhoH-like ATPase